MPEVDEKYKQKLTDKIEFESTRYGKMPFVLKVVFTVATVIGIACATYFKIQGIRITLGPLSYTLSIGGYVLSDVQYYFLLYGIFGGSSFLLLPMRRSDRSRVPWYDMVLGFMALAIPVFYFLYSYQIQFVGWVPAPNNLVLAVAILYALLMLEMSRRMGGNIFLGLCIVLFIYPMVANFAPGLLSGASYSFDYVVSFVNFGGDGIRGLPGKVLGDILIGFLIMAGVMIATGAGDFFIKLSVASLGRFRGGPAKVAVLASGLFGSITGSPIANIVAVGSFTIPMMKRLGYPPHYAGAIEACTSTGGVLMPPVMGVIAFVMAFITGIEYAKIAAAAAIPAILYYLGLLVQVDSYAVKAGMKGLTREEIPSAVQALKDGWQFLFAIAFLVFGLLYMRWEYLTPYYASVVLIIFSYANKKTALTPKKFVAAFTTIGTMVSQTTALILPFCFILAGFVFTGLSNQFTSGIVALAGGNILLILALGVLACYILGCLGMDIIAYIFLAVSMAPAAIQAGNLNTLAVHLFILYYAMLAAITPPVAIAAWVGAAMAGASIMKTSFTAMRLGAVIFFVPVFFIAHPALILQGEPLEILWFTLAAYSGTTLIALGLEGYFYGIGNLPVWSRPFLVMAGLGIGWGEWLTVVIGLLLAAVVVIVGFLRRISAREVAKA